MVLSFDLLLPLLDLHLRVSRYRFAPDDCYLLFCHRQSSLLATRSFLSSPCTNFDPSDFCQCGICLICLFAIFGLNGLTCSMLLFITSNFGSWYADCRTFCPGPASYEDRTLAAWSKKKNIEGRKGPAEESGKSQVVMIAAVPSCSAHNSGSRLLNCSRGSCRDHPATVDVKIVALSLPAGFRFGCFPRFSTLSSLRQTQINWAESEVGALSRFTRFSCEIRIVREFSSHFISCASRVFVWTSYITGHLFVLFVQTLVLSVDTMCTSGSSVGATFGFHQSPLLFIFCISLLWRGLSIGFHRSPLLFTSAHFYEMIFVWTCGQLDVFVGIIDVKCLLVVADTASLTRLFGWLKGVPPGLSKQLPAKKKWRLLDCPLDYASNFKQIGLGGANCFTFCEAFHRLFSGLCLLGWCFCLFGFVWFFFSAFFVGEKTSASNSSFIFFCFRIPWKLTDHAPCSLGNAGKKSSNFKEIWNDIKIH